MYYCTIITGNGHPTSLVIDNSTVTAPYGIVNFKNGITLKNSAVLSPAKAVVGTSIFESDGTTNETDVSIGKPLFTTQPKNTEIAEGSNSAAVTWKTNFTPYKIGKIQDGVFTQINPATITTYSLYSGNNYKIRAWYGSGNDDYIDSNAFSITKANSYYFYDQPQGGIAESASEGLYVTWTTSFSPVQIKGLYDGVEKMTISSSRSSIYWTLYGDKPCKIRAYYGWGTNDYVDSEEFYVNYKKREFTVQPQDSVIEIGQKSVDVGWELNFTPTSIHLYRDTYDVQTLSSDATSCNINYVGTFKIRAYYGTGTYDYVDSSSFKVSRNYAEFTQQPQGGEIPTGESTLDVTWEYNFTPDSQELYIVRREYDEEGGEYYFSRVSSTSIAKDARKLSLPANNEDEYYRIYAEINTDYEFSTPFQITGGTVIEPLVNNSSISAENVSTGTAVTVTGAAQGGTAPYKYAYYFKRSTNSKWNVVGTEFGSKTTATVTPTAAAVYDVKVIVKDSDGTTAEKIFQITAQSAPTNLSYINSEKVQIGDDIRVTGAAQGGSGGYKYAFYFKRSANTKWNKIGTEFGTATYAITVPKAAANYDMKVIVKDSAGTTAEKIFTVTVVESMELTNISTITATDVKINKTVTIAGRYVGGKKPVTYEFYFKRSANSKWNKLSYGNEKGTYAKFTPTKAAQYDIRSVATDSEGTKAEKIYTLTATE